MLLILLLFVLFWLCKWSARWMQSRARSSYAEPQPSLVLATSWLRVQRYDIFSSQTNLLSKNSRILRPPFTRTRGELFSHTWKILFLRARAFLSTFNGMVFCIKSLLVRRLFMWIQDSDSVLKTNTPFTIIFEV